MPREHFHRQLETLGAMVGELGGTADDQLERAMRALEHRDPELAAAVIADDATVNERCVEADRFCVMLLAEQQPVGGDLRRILASLAVVTELERIADHAVGIARTVARVGPGRCQVQPLIATMASQARRMLEASLAAFAALDPDAARAVGRLDDAVDELQEAAYRVLVGRHGADSASLARAVAMLWVTHDLERVADRATNIAEQVIYAATGERVELNASVGAPDARAGAAVFAEPVYPIP